MKRTLIAAAGFALFAASGLAGAASWTVIVQPGVYGRVAIGGYAEAPQVYAPQPVVAIDNGYGEVVEETVDSAYATDQPPVYLWVPEYQRTHWAQYCRDYGAYGVPVYFVDDGWYRANVMRRNWSQEQRSWSQQQWLEQDRLARDRFERQRFEQQRYEQQQRWDNERVWHDPRQQRRYDGSDQARADRERVDDAQNRMRWGSAHGYLPGQQQPSNPSRPQPGVGQWQPGAGQWQGGHQGGNQGGYPQGNGANGGNAGNVGQQPGAGQWQGGNGGHQGGNQGGYPQGNGANGGNAGNVGQQPGAGQWQGGNGGHAGGQPGNGGNAFQPPAASQPHGGGMAAGQGGERRGDDRGEGRVERRGQGESHGAFERGREGNRDR